MIWNYQPAYILTLRMDDLSRDFFDVQRKKYFPADKDYLNPHLTLFHQLPPVPQTISSLMDFNFRSFELIVTGLRNLGQGVAYRLESDELNHLHHLLRAKFSAYLSEQDRQGFSGHVTVQNKVTPESAKLLLAKLEAGFDPFKATALGLELWEYLGGPWKPIGYFPFVA